MITVKITSNVRMMHSIGPCDSRLRVRGKGRVSIMGPVHESRAVDTSTSSHRTVVHLIHQRRINIFLSFPMALGLGLK